MRENDNDLFFFGFLSSLVTRERTQKGEKAICAGEDKERRVAKKDRERMTSVRKKKEKRK